MTTVPGAQVQGPRGDDATPGSTLLAADAEFADWMTARQGALVRTAYLLTGSQHVDDSLLLAATDGGTMAQTVLRLDRDGTLTRATDVFSPDPSPDSDHVVFAARP